MKIRSNFICILYDEGDVVFPKYSKPTDVPRRVTGTRFDIVGRLPVQFLSLEGIPDDLNISNHYIPYGETREKYKNGLMYFNGADENNNIIKSTTGTVIFADEKPKKVKPKPTIKQQSIFKPPVKKEEL